MTGNPFIEAARRGDTAAQFELAMQLAGAGRSADALKVMAEAAQSGSSLALAQLGIWQLLGIVAQRNQAEGLVRIEAAAKQGDDIACLLMAGLSAMGTHAAQSWSAARDWLFASAEASNVRALTQLSLLLPHDFPHRNAFARKAASTGYAPALAVLEGEDGYDGEATLSDARAALDLKALTAPPSAATVREAPRAQIVRRFLAPSWCRYIRALAEPLLVPATVHNAERGNVALGVRTSSAMAFGPADTDPLMAIVAHRIAGWTGTPAENGEATTVMRYRQGEEYRPHVDFFDPVLPAIWQEAERAGQRVLTVLIWLNEGYEGGKTDFPLAGWRFRGGTGDALAFFNVTEDGAPDRRTIHAGLPVRAGEKWLISKWIRDRPQTG